MISEPMTLLTDYLLGGISGYVGWILFRDGLSEESVFRSSLQSFRPLISPSPLESTGNVDCNRESEYAFRAEHLIQKKEGTGLQLAPPIFENQIPQKTPLRRK